MTFRSKTLAALGLALDATASTAHAAALATGGLDTGDLAGWPATPGFVEVVTEADDAIVTPPFGEHFTPTEGSYFAKLTAGLDLGVYTILSQQITLGTTSKLSGSAAFLAF